MAGLWFSSQIPNVSSVFAVEDPLSVEDEEDPEPHPASMDAAIATHKPADTSFFMFFFIIVSPFLLILYMKFPGAKILRKTCISCYAFPKSAIFTGTPPWTLEYSAARAQ
jgi:hypothetical protein